MRSTGDVQLSSPRILAPLFAFATIVGLAVGGLGVALAVTESPSFAVLALPFLALAGTSAWLWRHHPGFAQVGPEGVHVRRRRLDRYVRYDDLVEVSDGVGGARLVLADETLRMFPQALEASASLVEEIRRRWAREESGPVVLHGRATQPVVYAVFLGLAFPGGAAALWAVTNPANGSGRWTALAFGLGLWAVAFGYWFWFLRRWQRSVIIDEVAVRRQHLVGETVEAVDDLVRVALVSVPSRLPKSTLERFVHRLRLTRSDGTFVEVGPAASSFPDYPSDAERAVLERACFRVRALHGLPGVPSIQILETPGASARLVVTHHGERSAGADQTTIVTDPPVAGRRVFTAWGGDATLSATGGWMAIWSASAVVVADLDGSDAGCWRPDDGRRVIRVDAHPARVVTGGPGGRMAHALDAVRVDADATLPADGALDRSPAPSTLAWSETLPPVLAAVSSLPDDGAARAGALVDAWAIPALAVLAGRAARGEAGLGRDDAAWAAVHSAAARFGEP